MTTSTSPHNLDPQKIYEFFCADFQSAWDALAARSTEEALGRGNFMFARSAMGLLEFASRLCSADTSGQALTDFSSELQKVEPRYFATLPTAGPRPGSKDGWTLPHAAASPPEEQLLGALFTLVRHGQAHQGQQTMAVLSDGSTFGVSLTGVLGRTLGEVKAGPRSKQHLRINALDSRATWITLSPDVLFLDVQTAMEQAKVLDRGLVFRYLSLDLPFERETLRAALAAAGLRGVNEEP